MFANLFSFDAMSVTHEVSRSFLLLHKLPLRPPIIVYAGAFFKPDMINSCSQKAISIPNQLYFCPLVNKEGIPCINHFLHTDCVFGILSIYKSMDRILSMCH